MILKSYDADLKVLQSLHFEKKIYLESQHIWNINNNYTTENSPKQISIGLKENNSSMESTGNQTIHTANLIKMFSRFSSNF